MQFASTNPRIGAIVRVTISDADSPAIFVLVLASSVMDSMYVCYVIDEVVRCTSRLPGKRSYPQTTPRLMMSFVFRKQLLPKSASNT